MFFVRDVYLDGGEVGRGREDAAEVVERCEVECYAWDIAARAFGERVGDDKCLEGLTGGASLLYRAKDPTAHSYGRYRERYER